MKKLFGTIAMAATLGLAGAAHAELMDSTFGNTVTVADASGMVLMTYHFNADGTVGMVAADGTAMDGTWTVEGSTLCLTAMENTSCNDIEDREVGETWTETDDEGNELTISITEGM